MSGQPSTGSTVTRVRVVNLANALTVMRLLLVPVFLTALFAHGGHDEHSRRVAFVVFVIAIVTDQLDGALARNFDMVTDFGALIDPIADKALIGSALIGLSMLGDLWPWVTVLILARELGITALRFAVLHRGVIPASRGGKAKTLLQAVGIGLLVLPLDGPWLVTAWIVMTAAVVLTVVTGIDYVRGALTDLRSGAPRR